MLQDESCKNFERQVCMCRLCAVVVVDVMEDSCEKVRYAILIRGAQVVRPDVKQGFSYFAIVSSLVKPLFESLRRESCGPVFIAQILNVKCIWASSFGKTASISSSDIKNKNQRNKRAEVLLLGSLSNVLSL